MFKLAFPTKRITTLNKFNNISTKLINYKYDSEYYNYRSQLFNTKNNICPSKVKHILTMHFMTL